LFCISEPNPHIVKKCSKNIIIKPNWNDIKISVMKQILEIKFSNKELREKLLETGNQYIQEGNWWNDVFWGVDLKSDPPIGHNHLGKIIMEIRHNILYSNLL
jgi:predicted NAD-dependent protein-ADP-ribosyltransferase YbiA (DUF1768 family)